MDGPLSIHAIVRLMYTFLSAGFQLDYPGGGIFREQFEMFFMGGAASKMADLVFR